VKMFVEMKFEDSKLLMTIDVIHVRVG